jgi:NAD(P)-dependent dehydrogenase (short-subunit alcohol dehydrogenase family)
LRWRAPSASRLKHRGGSIVNTASAAGLIGLPGGTAYVATKHGVAGLTKSAALEYAKSGIRINAVCPGFIRTAMVERTIDGGMISEEAMIAAEPIGRIGKPEEIANVVLFLCSDEASFVTGLPMPVDGGYVAQWERAAPVFLQTIEYGSSPDLHRFKVARS